MKRQVAAAMVAGTLAAGSALAAQGDWLARARVIDIRPDASSSALNIDVKSAATGAKVANLEINPWILGIGVGIKF